jgi:hypothetical protein
MRGSAATDDWLLLCPNAQLRGEALKTEVIAEQRSFSAVALSSSGGCAAP